MLLKRLPVIVCALVFITSPVFAYTIQEVSGTSNPDGVDDFLIGAWLDNSGDAAELEAFADYAKQKYGYDVQFTFEEAPFETLFQKAAASLATRSDDYNIIVSDSQWLGGFAAPGWIVKLNDMIESNPNLKAIEYYDQIVVDTYMSYPLGSDNYWGFPLEGDTMVLYVRKDKLLDPAERKAFNAKFGFEMPKTFEYFES